MARRSTNSSMSAMIASLDENSSARESSPTPISEPIANHNSSSVTTGELPQDNPALTQAFSRALEESLHGIFAAVRAQVGGNPSSAAPGLVASATDVGASPSTSFSLSGPHATTGNLTVPSFISTYCTLDSAQPHVTSSTPSCVSQFVSQPQQRDGLVRPSWTGGWQQHTLRWFALQFGFTNRKLFTVLNYASSPSKGICGRSRVCTSSQQSGNKNYIRHVYRTGRLVSREY